MKLGDNYWLESAYYIDIDHHGQLRIAGPNNHLYFGSVNVVPADFAVDLVTSNRQNELEIHAHFKKSKLFWHDPAMGPMLRVRSFIEPPAKTKPSFAKAIKQSPSSLLPQFVGGSLTKKGFELNYRRFFDENWYGTKLIFDPDVKVVRQPSRQGYNLESGGKIKFTLITENSTSSKPAITKIFPAGKSETKLMGILKYETEFLVRYNRTSGFDFGTVFPRDWMEAADLGGGDLLPAAVRYMYSQALKLVSPAGVGWHENIAGELEAETNSNQSELPASLEALLEKENRLGRLMQQMMHKLQESYVIRNMIDIEPHYILGLQQFSPSDLPRSDQDRLRRSARYLVAQAESNQLITFKKIPELFRRHRTEEYYQAGNWRDSERAYKMIHPVIAPYDVNVVFYPEALKLLLKHARWFGLSRSKLRGLVEKWQGNKDLYRFENPDGKSAMALALFDVIELKGKLRYRRLEVNHIDEAYELFYGSSVETDLVSFCDRLLDKNYFFTPAGPTLVGADDGYTTLDYHGRVSWTKQTAFVTAGLVKQLRSRRFSPKTNALIEKALEATCKAGISALEKLGATELHFYNGKPQYYDDQPRAEGPMNKVQLWSAVGARQIEHDYQWLMAKKGRGRRVRAVSAAPKNSKAAH